MTTPPEPSPQGRERGTALKEQKEKEPKRKIKKKFSNFEFLKKRIKTNSMRTFFEIWTLLEPKAEYANLFGHCKRLWETWPADKQDEVFLKIEKKKIEKRFVDYNPLLALRNNANESSKRRETMTFAQYYARYDTTAETDGWHMENPTGNQVIYVRFSNN